MTAAPPQRGEVYAARLGPVEGSEQGGTRPIVVVSNDEFNRLMPVVAILPLTTHRGKRRIYPSEVLVPSGAAGLESGSLILTHQIRTIATSRLGRRIGHLDQSTVAQIDDALRLHLSLK